MESIAKNLFEIRNKYLIPLIQFNPSKINTEYFNIKPVICNHLKNVRITGSNKYELTLPKDIFLKSVLNEIIQFYLRTALQYRDLINMEMSATKSWLLVTNYYHIFFA